LISIEVFLDHCSAHIEVSSMIASFFNSISFCLFIFIFYFDFKCHFKFSFNWSTSFPH